MWVLTFADLRMRARQFAIATLGATLVFSVALVLSGLSGGFREETKRTVEGVGADYFVVPKGGGGPFTTPTEIPRTVAADMAERPGVTRADPIAILGQVVKHKGSAVDAHLIAFQPGGLGAPPGGPSRLRPGEAVVDALTKVPRGSTFTLGGQKFTAVREVEGYSYFAGLPNVYISLKDAQQIAFDGRDTITAVAVQGKPKSVPSGYRTFNQEQARTDVLRRLDNGIRSIDLSQYFLWLVAVVIIGAVVYLSSLERVRDFAVLKAIGSSSVRLYAGVAAQASIVSLLSAGIAIALEPLLAMAIPMTLAIPTYQYYLLPTVALVVGLLASLSGIRQAVKVDPATAFAG